jgi:hypothetical protein
VASDVPLRRDEALMHHRGHAARALGLGAGRGRSVAGALRLAGEGVHLRLELPRTRAEPLHLFARHR